MSTTTIAPGQRWVWTLTFVTNDTRDIVATDLHQALNGAGLPTVIKAERVAVYEPPAPPPA